MEKSKEISVEEKEMLIGIGGRKKSGKDTAGIYLSLHHNMYKHAFADALKELCALSFGVSEYDLYNLEFKEIDFVEFNKDKNSQYKFFECIITEEQTDDFLKHLSKLADSINLKISKGQKKHIREKLIGKKINSFRQLMQFVGTEVVRGVISNTFWIDVLHNQIKNKNRVVITDARFPNERQYIRKRNGKLLLVKRNTKLNDNHISENQLNEKEFDGVIDNNKDIPYLEYKIEEFYLCLAQNKKFKLMWLKVVLWIKRFFGFFRMKKK